MIGLPEASRLMLPRKGIWAERLVRHIDARTTAFGTVAAGLFEQGVVKILPLEKSSRLAAFRKKTTVLQRRTQIIRRQLFDGDGMAFLDGLRSARQVASEIPSVTETRCHQNRRRS
jgi:hypothetical protein